MSVIVSTVFMSTTQSGPFSSSSWIACCRKSGLLSETGCGITGMDEDEVLDQFGLLWTCENVKLQNKIGEM